MLPVQIFPLRWSPGGDAGSDLDAIALQAVATRPGVVEPGPSLDDLLANVAGIRARCRLVDETVAVVDELARLLTAVPSAYRRVHDANIVATMLVWGVPRLLTNNLRDFARYAHLITVIPLTSQAA